MPNWYKLNRQKTVKNQLQAKEILIEFLFYSKISPIGALKVQTWQSGPSKDLTARFLT
jgi:hypothetical protein